MSSGTGGVPVLLVHGFGADLGTWALTMPALARDRAVHAFDLPCHGQSNPDADADFGAVANGLLDALEIERVHLVGHSLGGAAALDAAAARPQRVASLTLIASAGLGREIDGRYLDAFIAARDRAAIEALRGSLFADEKRVSRFFVDELLRSKQRDGAEDCLRRIAGRAFPQGRQGRVLVDDLRALPVPVEIIWGVEDRVIPVAHARALAGTCSVRTIERAGHMVHIEAADAVNRHIRAFIEAAEADVR
jgi:pyruvate dehydrogenase E2 component (dihydrolipoamide acetyltransferase)